MERAREWPGVRQVHLSVTDAAPEARRLYESAGFREWGVEPRSLEAEGRSVSERHLVLELD
jgi:RimJ/RimL family protein N-acetyltransferase